MILILTVSIVGWVSAHRIFSNLRSIKVLNEKTICFLQIVILLLSLMPLWLHLGLLFCGFFFSLINITALLIPKIARERRRQEFLKNRVFAMDAALLSVQSGKSFRQALLEIKRTEMNYGFYVHEIVSLVLLREDFAFKTLDPLALRFYQELKIFEGLSHKIGDRIQSFRRTLKIEEQFRQKSRTATLQARAQSIMVGILYILAWIFDFANYGTSLSWKMLGSSLLLFVLGTLWIWKLGRTHRWMV